MDLQERLKQCIKDRELLEEEEERIREQIEKSNPISIYTVSNLPTCKITVAKRRGSKWPVGLAVGKRIWGKEYWHDENMQGQCMEIKEAEDLVKALQTVIKLAKEN